MTPLLQQVFSFSVQIWIVPSWCMIRLCVKRTLFFPSHHISGESCRNWTTVNNMRWNPAERAAEVLVQWGLGSSPS